MRLLRSRSLIFDVYGAYVRDLGGWISIADLVALLGQLGTEEAQVRSSVSRFAAQGLLSRHRNAGQVGYELTEQAWQILAEGDDRIFKRLEPAALADGWVLVTFSVPEEIRAARHRLRSRLARLGFGNLGSGLWIAPQRVMDRTVDMVTELGLAHHVDVFEAHHRAFGEPAELVRRCWDIPAIAGAYREFVADCRPVLTRIDDRPAGDHPVDAFVNYTTALHRWRKLPYVDPGLPSDLLPDDWEGAEAGLLFAELRARLEPAAKRHVSHTVRE